MKEFIQNELACIRALEDKGSDRYNELTWAIKWLDEEKKEEEVEPITDGLNTEFQKQVSYLIASSINKEHEYSEGYVKWVSQSLLEYAKKESVKESDEDEKIRNEILEYFTITRSRDFVANPERQKWISYIERQKEYPTNEEMLRTLRLEYEKGVADTVAKYEQKKQKSVWSEDKFPKDIERDATQFCFDEGINITPYQAKKIASHYLMVGHNEGYVEGRKNAHIPAKELGLPSSMDYKQEWSEEDEQKYQSIRAILLEDTTKKIGKRTYGDVLEWYESKGKGRRTQPKQVWSEEDEVYLQDALWCVKQASKVARGENDMGACWSAERWLNSLRKKLIS